MAYIPYIPEDGIPLEDRVPDRDHILRIHGVHPRVMRQHFELYRELMHHAGPLSREQRESVAIVISGANGCHY